MKIYKKFLAILLCVFMIPVMCLLGGCNGKTDIEFPVDEKGYPQSNVVIINDKSYPIELMGDRDADSIADSEIQVKMDENSDILEVILPQALPFNYWSLEEQEYINLRSYSRTSFPIEDKNMLEGISADVQKFQIQVEMNATTEILLKWSNIDEADKLFKDKQEAYLLKIVVSY